MYKTGNFMQFLQIIPIYNVVDLVLQFTQLNDIILKNIRLLNYKSIFLSL